MPKLIFVYNAKAGPIHAILDSAHKLLSPSTYECNLCALTYNSFGENKRWRKFRTLSKLDMVFLHKDEFQTIYPDESFELPVILSKDEGLKELISSRELNAIEHTEELILEIKKRVNP